MSRATVFVAFLSIVLQLSPCLGWHGVPQCKRTRTTLSATMLTNGQRLGLSHCNLKLHRPVLQPPAGCQLRTHRLLASSKPRGAKVGTDATMSLRHRLRAVTGFSLTALRATLRAATGISATAIYATALAATGAWIRLAMKVLLDVFPTWLRYFLQPFLVMYYVPLFVLRNLTGPTRSIAKRKHELVMDGWREAVDLADKTKGGWPVHVHDGIFEKDDEGVDVNDAVAEAVQISLELQESNAT